VVRHSLRSFHSHRIFNHPPARPGHCQFYLPFSLVRTSEVIYILERWPNRMSAWRRFDISVNKDDGIHSLLRYTSPAPAVHYISYLPVGQPAGKYLLSKISKGGQGQHSMYLASWVQTIQLSHSHLVLCV
jgi:hypothetical protein